MNDHQRILWAIIQFACKNEQTVRMEKAASDFQECVEGRCTKRWCGTGYAAQYPTLAQITASGDRI